MKIVFLDASTLGSADLSKIASLGEFTRYEITEPSQVLERAKDAEIIITNKVVLTREMMENLPRLKGICVAATGMNNIDLAAAKERGISVKNVAGYSTSQVCQHTFAMILGFLGHVRYHDEYCKSPDGWAKSPIFTHMARQPRSVDGLRWGIVGMGEIGRTVANTASALYANVFYFSTSGQTRDPLYERMESIDEMMSSCDIISIHAPLNERTKGLVNEERLRMLKPGAMLINVGRGGIVDEEAVAKLLENGADFYYGADVLETEPMREDHPFLRISKDPKVSERLILTPHIAWAYDVAVERLVDGIAANIEGMVK